MFVIPDSPTAAQVANYYDSLDQHYRIVWGAHLHHGLWQHSSDSVHQATTNLIDYAARWLRLDSSSNVADIGCGYGTTANYLNTRLGCSVTGYTVSHKQCEIGQQMGLNPKVTLQQIDWLTVPRQRNQFDGMISLECLCHISKKKQFFDQVHQFLKPKGRAVITTLAVSPNHKGPLQSILLGSLCRQALIPNLGTTSELETWAKNVGLQVVNNANLTPAVTRTWPAIFARAAVRLPKAWLRHSLPFPPRATEFKLGLNAARMLLAYTCNALQYRALVVEKR